MSKLKGKNKKWGRCPIHGQGCEVCSDIQSNSVNRKTDVSIHMQFEKRLIEDDAFREDWIENEIQQSSEYFVNRLLTS